MLRKSWLTILLISLIAVLAAGCGRSPAPAPTPIATALVSAPTSRSSGGGTAASGEIVAAEEASMGFTLAGRVETVAVAVGDEVQQAELLLALESSSLEAAVAQAEAALQAATVQLTELQSGPRPEQVAAAQAAYETALAQYTSLENGPSDEESRIALATLRKAEVALQQAQAAYDEIAWINEVTIMTQALALQQATLDYESALANYDLVTQGARPEDVEAARANLESAQAQLDVVLNGPTAGQTAAAEAAVAQAEAALETARATLEQATITAPFAGTVTALHVSAGETVLPGQPLLTLANLDHLQAETTDLSERDVARVAVGQKATVYVEALGVDIEGRVLRIAPQATKVGGDVVYAVVVELAEQPAVLRWGMSVEVEITTD